MMKVILVIVAIVMMVEATSFNIQNALKNLNKEGKEQLCKQIGHKSHQLWSPIRYTLFLSLLHFERKE